MLEATPSDAKLVPTILSYIAPFLVYVLEFAKGLDDINALSSPCNDEFRAFVKTIIQNLECFKDVTPVLSFIIQALVDHVHDLVELGGSGRVMPSQYFPSSRGSTNAQAVHVRVVCHLSNLAHLSTGRAPWVIAGSCVLLGQR